MADGGRTGFHAGGILDTTLDTAVDIFGVQNRADATSITGKAGGIIGSPEIFKYPLDVGKESEEQPNSVLFSIFARENTRAGNKAAASKLPDYLIVNKDETTSQNTSTIDIREAGELGIQLGVAGTVASAARGLVSGFGASGLGSTVAAGTGAAVGFAVGTKLVEAGAGASIGLNADHERMLSAIELHVAQPPVAQYSASWDNADTGIVGGLLSSGAKLPSIDEITSVMKGDDNNALTNTIGGQGLRGVSRGAIQAAAKITEAIGITGDIAGSFDVLSGNTLNPFKEQLFRSMGFRKFAFSYKFAPKNRTEYENVMAIIHLFKYHMHPEKDVANMTLVYPSEFDIEFRYRGSINTNLSKISSCVLTDVKVTYGNQDAFNTIKGEDGKPSEINLEIAFAETDMLIRSEDGTGISEHWRDSH